MTENALDREITEIERYAIGKWLSSGDGLVCARCGGIYIPSQTSDSDLCAMCVPLRNLAVGDKSRRLPECEHCGGPIKGRRGDSKYCCDSHKTLASRKRKSGNAEAMQEGINPAQEGEHIEIRAIRKQEGLEEGSAT